MCFLGMQENVLWTVTPIGLVFFFYWCADIRMYWLTPACSPHNTYIDLGLRLWFNKLFSYFKGYDRIKIKIENQSLHVEKRSTVKDVNIKIQKLYVANILFREEIFATVVNWWYIYYKQNASRAKTSPTLLVVSSPFPSSACVLTRMNTDSICIHCLHSPFFHHHRSLLSTTFMTSSI